MTTENRMVVEETRHSKLGASAASRWLACPGSIQLTDKLLKAGTIKPRTSKAAAEGTCAHLVFAGCMEDGDDAKAMLGVEIEVEGWVFEVDQEMVDSVQEVLDWCRNRISKAKKKGLEVEVYVECGMESVTDEDAYGTGDVMLHIVDDRLIVVDLKYGRGVTVEPDSSQNYYYGYLALENYVPEWDSIKVIELWIAQPRIPHPAGTIRRHITNVQEVKDWWHNTVLPGMEKTRDPNAELAIGEWCRFCPSKSNCPALKAEVFEFPASVDPAHLDDDELGQAILTLNALIQVKTNLQAEALRRARGGSKITGFKLVRQRGNREWKKELPMEIDGQITTIPFKDAVLEEFGVEAYTDPVLKSPAQIEKMDGGNDFASKWAFSPDKGLTLAPDSDKRLEVRPNVERFYGSRS